MVTPRLETTANESKNPIPAGFVKCQYDEKIIPKDKAYKSPHSGNPEGGYYCNPDCCLRFTED